MGERPIPTTWAEATVWCHRTCLSLPGASLDHPFGPDSDVFRVHGKMFALHMTHRPLSEHPLVNLKAEPDEVPLLIAEHAMIRPGYHMSKRHWITVELRPDADLELVAELVEDSYDNVVAGLPARLRTTLRSLGAGQAASTLVVPVPAGPADAPDHAAGPPDDGPGRAGPGRAAPRRAAPRRTAPGLAGPATPLASRRSDPQARTRRWSP